MKLIFVFLITLISLNLFAQTGKFELIKELFSKGKYDSVILYSTNELNRIKSNDSNFVKYTKLRLFSNIELQNFSPAISDYKTIIGIFPSESSNYVGISYLYGEIGNYDSCMFYLNQAIRINDKDVIAFNNLCFYYNKLENYDNAIIYANRGLKLKPDSIWTGALLSNRSYSYLGKCKPKKALKDITKSIRYNANNSYAYYYRALGNIKLKKYNLVCDDIIKAETLGAKNLVSPLKREWCK